MKETDIIADSGRADWVKLRTLATLRWVAIVGQIAAITFAQQVYDIQLELGLCYFVIAAAVMVNLLAVMVYPDNRRLTSTEMLFWLLFDIVQLSALLSLTGGLHNPFAMLVLVPVTIAATVLPLFQTMVLASCATVAISMVAVFYVPLQTSDGFILRVPPVFLFGFWTALNIGVFFLAIYTRRVSAETETMSRALTATQLALAREQKLTDLGGVVAAAAHELGTPLATIKLVSSELADELSHDAALREDAELIREQANRCRDILHSMGRAGKDDKHMRFAPLQTVVGEAAAPHIDRGIHVEISAQPRDGCTAVQPTILRRSEYIHGLRNLIQNAVDFAKSDVSIRIVWDDLTVRIKILDDGPGYPPHLFSRLGDPFIRRRRKEAKVSGRIGYKGMGLGLFIAKTLLERTGATLNFSNNPDFRQSGALVVVTWPIDRMVPAETNRDALGQNSQMTT